MRLIAQQTAGCVPRSWGSTITSRCSFQAKLSAPAVLRCCASAQVSSIVTASATFLKPVGFDISPLRMQPPGGAVGRGGAGG